MFCSGSNSIIKRGYWCGSVTGKPTVDIHGCSNNMLCLRNQEVGNVRGGRSFIQDFKSLQFWARFSGKMSCKNKVNYGKLLNQILSDRKVPIFGEISDVKMCENFHRLCVSV